MKAAVFRTVHQPLTIELEHINEAFTALLGGEVARQVIRFAQ